MKIHILSDLHNEFSLFELPETNADIIVLAGDIDIQLRAVPWAKQLGKPVIYLLGNHEFYGRHYEMILQGTRIQAEGSNIHFLDNAETVIGGVRFIGGTLWTDFQVFGQAQSIQAMMSARRSMNDFRHITIGPDKRRLTPEDTVSLHETALAFLSAKLKEPFSGKTVVVTHHAPSMESVHERFKRDILTAAFASDLTHLMNPDVPLWIHGHVHNSSDYHMNGTRVVCNPRGYQRLGEVASENSQFNPGLVVEL